MIKRDELADPASCINKAADDEPVFVLRAQDFLMIGTLDYWTIHAMMNKVNPAKIAEARNLLGQVVEWQATHLVKLPD